MHRFQMIALILVLASSSAVCGKKQPDWLIGKVLDSEGVKTRFGIAPTAGMIPTIRDTQLMIFGDEFAYVIEDSRVSGQTSLIGLTERAISNRHHGCRFIVGDDVKYYQEKAILHVLDTDGKECNVEVLRQERLHDTPSQSFPGSSQKTIEPIRKTEQSAKSSDLSPPSGSNWKVMKDSDKSMALWHNEKPSSQVQKEVLREMDRFYADPANLNIPVSDAFANLFPSLASSAGR